MGAAITDRAGQVLVVEDEFLVSLGITSLLEDLGFTIVGPAARVDDACKLASDGHFACAVLDINVAGEMSWPVARILKARNVPVVFLSGYLHSSVALPPDLADIPICLKPLDEAQITSVIDRALIDRS